LLPLLVYVRSLFDYGILVVPPLYNLCLLCGCVLS
jgi:hypothetical protein